MNKKGFTLVEILAVIVILGILVTVAMTAVVPRINQAKKETFIIDAKNILKTADALYVEKQALNELPNVYNKNIEGIYKKYVYNVYGKPRYTAYAIDINYLRKIMNIEKDYTGYVLFADYGDYIKSYINLANNDYILKKDNCIKNNINMCFFSSETLNSNSLLTQKNNSRKQITFSQINPTNSYYICLDC